MIPDLIAEDFDAIMAGMSITPERDEQIDFTQPYYPPSPSVYLARAGASDAVAQGRIGAHSSTIHSDYLTEAGVAFTAFDDAQVSVDAVLNGDVDAILVDHAFAVENVTEFAGRLGIVGPQVELDQGIGIGVRENSDLKGKFDVVIRAMQADGTLNALIPKVGGRGRRDVLASIAPCALRDSLQPRGLLHHPPPQLLRHPCPLPSQGQASLAACARAIG